MGATAGGKMPDLAGTKAAYYGFTGLIDSNGATRIATALNAAVNNGCDEVHLVMSSLGGYVADGIYLYNHMRSLPLKVVAYNAGSIASIAVAVFVSATERYCSAHALFMIHPTTMPSREGMTWGHLESSLQAALAEDQRTESILRERTRLTNDLLDARRTRDVHILPQDALTHGLVDGIAEFALPKGAQIFQI
jgi:ATP-dependent Clp protease, protease subunit